MSIVDRELEYKLIPFSMDNDLLASYKLNLNYDNQLVHFEVHDELLISMPMAFHVSQGETTELSFRKFSGQGVVQMKTFVVDIEKYK